MVNQACKGSGGVRDGAQQDGARMAVGKTANQFHSRLDQLRHRLIRLRHRMDTGATREGEDTPKLDQARRGNIEAQGAGLGRVVKGRAAEGATRSDTEARGAGLSDAVKGGAAKGATRSNTEAQGAVLMTW